SPLLVNQAGGTAESVALHLDVGATWPGMRIEDDDRNAAVSERNVDLPRNRLQRLVRGTSGDCRSLSIGVPRVLVGGLDAGAREDIVELVEQDAFPGLFQPPQAREPGYRTSNGADFLRQQE